MCSHRERRLRAGECYRCRHLGSVTVQAQRIALSFAAMSRRTVFLDPDGTRDVGLVVIVSAGTGVFYRTQCGGLSTVICESEGFLVLCPPMDVACEHHVQPELAKFFKRLRRTEAAHTWPPERVDELEALIERVACWSTSPDDVDNDVRGHLALDRARLSECIEAWVPVHSPHGPAILTFDNSD
jgi:hypothetical protein